MELQSTNTRYTILSDKEFNYNEVFCGAIAARMGIDQGSGRLTAEEVVFKAYYPFEYEIEKVKSIHKLKTYATKAEAEAILKGLKPNKLPKEIMDSLKVVAIDRSITIRF